MDNINDKYYTDDSNDRPYWIAEEYYSRGKFINKNKYLV